MAAVSADGRLVRMLVRPGQVPECNEISLCDGRAAVVSSNATVTVVDLATGLHVARADELFAFNPDSGLALTPHRLLFIGLGFESQPEWGRPAEALTLFSTDLAGKDLRIAERETVPPQDFGSAMLFARGFGVRWDDRHWAVTKSLPRRVRLVTPEGQVSRTSESLGDIPSVPISSLPDQASILDRTPHVVGLFKARRLLGVVWRNPPTPGPQVEVEWMDKRLRPVGRTPIRLGRALGPSEFVLSVVSNGRDALYFVIVRRPATPDGLGTSTVIQVRISVSG